MNDRNPNAQRLASLCVEIAKKHRSPNGEQPQDYMKRIRGLADRVQHERRKAKRKAARSARRNNRHG